MTRRTHAPMANEGLINFFFEASERFADDDWGFFLHRLLGVPRLYGHLADVHSWLADKGLAAVCCAQHKHQRPKSGRSWRRS